MQTGDADMFFLCTSVSQRCLRTEWKQLRVKLTCIQLSDPCVNVRHTYRFRTEGHLSCRAQAFFPDRILSATPTPTSPS